jgi:hypothetical protein
MAGSSREDIHAVVADRIAADKAARYEEAASPAGVLGPWPTTQAAYAAIA